MADNDFLKWGQPGDMPDFNALKKFLIPFILVLMVILSVNQIYFKIDAHERGVIQRFGKYVRTLDPGPHFKLPWGMETLTKIAVTTVRQEEFGFVGAREESLPPRGFFRGASKSSFKSSRAWSNRQFNQKVEFPSESFLAESLMLTGDLNFADVNWAIQYVIEDPVAYLFNVRDVKETLRNMAESVMREVVGDGSIDKVLTIGKQNIQDRALEELREALKPFNFGIRITLLALQSINPPEEVKGAFERVNKAEQQRSQIINEAQAEYNKIIPKAKGQAKQIVNEAEAYAVRRTNLAKGDAEKFLSTWKEYRLARGITRRRLYLEAMRQVFPEIKKKIIVDSDVKGVLPLLNLNEGGNKR